mmetsp:Transcript_64678/g.127825  ORF Transcript_64678/g.127825 Transcript_64678/m.127825 type:complete len:215 (-) Transcript_64678:1799-2443(-)
MRPEKRPSARGDVWRYSSQPTTTGRPSVAAGSCCRKESLRSRKPVALVAPSHCKSTDADLSPVLSSSLATMASLRLERSTVVLTCSSCLTERSSPRTRTLRSEGGSTTPAHVTDAPTAAVACSGVLSSISRPSAVAMPSWRPTTLPSASLVRTSRFSSTTSSPTLSLTAEWVANPEWASATLAVTRPSTLVVVSTILEAPLVASRASVPLVSPK